jgi:dTDP-4-amino-4,6-dideoxygalactose transaminase
MWKIPLFTLNYDHQEDNAVSEVLRSKWLSAGPKIEEFEKNFAAYLGGGVHCCTVSSCTAALHMALHIADIGPGDEVILPGLTFIADLNVIKAVGATPVVADSKSFTDWNISPSDVARKITSQTKALIIVHYAGYPCEMQEIKALCREKNLLLIEDVAHAVGADYQGQKCGTFGDIACFSFFSNKNLSVGEGGMFVTSKDEFAGKARLFRSHGMTSMTIDRHQGKTISYDVVEPGLNYRMDEIRAALGIVQLGKLDAGNRRRGIVVRQYLEQLAKVDEITIPWPAPQTNQTSSYHIFPILLAKYVDRNSFMAFMKGRGIQTSIHYPAFNQFSFYKNLIKEELGVAAEISNRVVTLPLFPDMSKYEVAQVANAVTEYFNNTQRKP